MENRFNSKGGADFKRGGTLLADSRVDDTYHIENVDYNKHDLSHALRFTSSVGELLPHKIHCVPGDKFRINASTFVQYAPSFKPLLDKLETKLHFFFVPQNLVESGWNLFYTGGRDGKYSRNRPYISLQQPVDGNQVILDIAWNTSTEKCTVKRALTLASTALYCWNRSHNTDRAATSISPDQWLDILNYTFGKGSLLDMLNLGRYAFSLREYTPSEQDEDTRYFYLEYNLPNTAGSEYSVIPIAPLLAYQRIYNDFYRKEDLSQDVFFEPTYPVDAWNAFSDSNDDSNIGWLLTHLVECPITLSHFTLDENNCYFVCDLGNLISSLPPIGVSERVLAFLLCKRPVPFAQDYFTTALPFTQRGDIAELKAGLYATSKSVAIPSAATTYSYVRPINQGSIAKGTEFSVNGLQTTSSARAEADIYSKFTFNDIRQLSALTRWLERNAVAGYKMMEQIYARFGVSSLLHKFDGPQYLGGLIANAVPDKISSQTDNENAVIGEFAGQSNAYDSTQNTIEVECEDYGYIFCIIGTAPKTSYSNVIDEKDFYLFDRTKLFTPEFMHLTEEPLMKNNLLGIGGYIDENVHQLNGTHSLTESAYIGYVPRYNSYRYMMDTCHGELNKYDGDEPYWTMARDFNGGDPKLNVNFVSCFSDSPNVTDVFNVEQTSHPSQTIEINFGIDVLSKVCRISLPMTL